MYHLIFWKDLTIYTRNKKKAGLIKFLVILFPIHFNKFQLSYIKQKKRVELDTVSRYVKPLIQFTSIHTYFFIISFICSLYIHEENESDTLETIDKKAKTFIGSCQKITQLNEEYIKLRKISIQTQIIELIVERLPTMILLVTILFSYKDCQRLGKLIGLCLNNYFYIALVIISLICGAFGLITPLIDLRYEIILPLLC